MRFDIVTIFPEFFGVLDISLLGKAREQGAVEVEVHDLRNWAQGKHRSVDDTPAGGGAGMVMRPDVWGSALDQVLPAPSEPGRCVLAIPTPGGQPLTQQILKDLAKADQIVVACGRYEGLDARVAQHYRESGVEVLEFSLGDYVLNGGEVAAVALVEGVGRLLEGVVGNPESLVEESHGQAGLLEYPVYTQPRQWRGLDTPSVLTSGDHGKIAAWRRKKSLEKTARLRPDMLRKLNPSELSGADRAAIAAAGYLLVPEFAQVRFRPAVVADLAELSELAGITFPDACPPQISLADIEAHIAREFSQENLASYLADPSAQLWVAESGGRLVGYSLTLRQAPQDLGAIPRGSAYISKAYTLAEYRGSGVSAALVEQAIEQAREHWDPSAVALATNIGNKRAARFYRKLGFRRVGRRHYLVGEADNIDDVFVLDFTDE